MSAKPTHFPYTTDEENTNNQLPQSDQNQEFDYSKRAQWLRAGLLGANDGLVSTASIMMGVGAVKQDVKAMILTGFAGLVAGACSMAIGDFVSVYSQLDIEIAQMRRKNTRQGNTVEVDDADSKEKLPSPVQAAAASAFAFALGSMVPLLAASFVKNYKVRLAVVAGAVSMALVLWMARCIPRKSIMFKGFF